MRTLRKSPLVLALIAALILSACSGAFMQRAADINETFAGSLIRFQDTVERHYKAGNVPEDRYKVWQAGLKDLASVSQGISQAILASEPDDVRSQVDAGIGLIDKLIADEVVKLSGDAQFAFSLGAEALRSALVAIKA